MKNIKKRFYQYLFTIVILIFSAEALLEYRHYLKGYNTPLFGLKDKNPNSSKSLIDDNNRIIISESNKFGPTEHFPFKSKLFEPEQGYTYLIWIASASHAYGSRTSASKVFPNLICKNFKKSDSCMVINGSKAGMTVSENISLLKKYVDIYKPRVSVLYQMSIIIEEQQKVILNKATVNEPEQALKSNSIFDYSYFSEAVQKSSLYTHLSDYIGGNIKLQGPLKDELPQELIPNFDSHIYDFIETSRELGVNPVLSTFAASHNQKNIENIPQRIKTNFVKYNSYLSPVGWANTIKRYNQRIRFIARKESIPLIDLAEHLNGKSDIFVDFVHFNEKGHERVAEIFANELEKILQE